MVSLHRYLFGAAASMGGYTVDDLNEQWVWGAGWDWNHQNGHVPRDDLLFRARYVSAAMLAIGMMTLFAIANKIGGRLTAYIATLLYATSPALLLNGRRAMMEGAMTLFSLLVVLAGLWVVQSRKWWTFALLGLFSGLAVASKHTSVVTVAAVFVACGLVIIYPYLQEKSHSLTDGITQFSALVPQTPPPNPLPEFKEGESFSPEFGGDVASATEGVETPYYLKDYDSIIKQLLYLIMAGILSLTVFYGLNPAWWSNPVARAKEVSAIRLDFMQAQQDTFGGYESFTDRLNGFFWQTFGMQNMVAETDIDNFIDNLSDETATYEASLFSGFINGGFVVMPLAFLGLSLLGGIALWLDTRTHAELRFVIAVWVVAMIILTLFLTPLEWQRYYLPVYPPVMLLSGLGVRYLIHRVRHLIT
ncbi:MAG: glycosyltransferase family 39 protein [Anaerolineae bacterium]|nr:glycosyltransferase family 39 protein [Anaerolineae bacterium]